MISKEILPNLMNNLISKLKELNITKFDYLGSTRQLHNNQITRDIKDIDLVCLVNDTNEYLEKLKITFKDNNYRILFGNVFSITDYKYNNIEYQIDLMLASTYSYEYLKDIRFNSNDKEPLKGLHKTELIRSILKYHGYSLGTIGIKQYKLRNNVLLKDITTYIEKKIKRCRVDVTKLEWQNYKTNIDSLDVLVDNTKLKSRIKIGQYTIKNIQLFRKLIDEFFVYEYIHINKVLKNSFGLKNNYKIYLHNIHTVFNYLMPTSKRNGMFDILLNYYNVLKQTKIENYYNITIQHIISNHVKSNKILNNEYSIEEIISEMFTAEMNKFDMYKTIRESNFITVKPV